MEQKDVVNILLVDDRPENLLALEAIVEREEYRLVKAFSGEEALVQLMKHDFATILLDVQMPGIDGFATAKIIKAREKTKHIPIIFITANNMDSEHVFAGYSLGAVDYLLKPFDPFILNAKVERFVDIYRLNRRLHEQTESLAEKTRELEKAYLELENAATVLRESQALTHVIGETSIDSMFVIDDQGRIRMANPTVQSMFGYEEAELTGKNIMELVVRDQHVHLQSILGSANGVGLSRIHEVAAMRKDKSVFPAEVQVGSRFVKTRLMIACTIRDVTDKKRSEELIAHMAYHDGLTNLANRRLFNDRLNNQINRARQLNRPFAILYADIDRFKFINDSLGHHAGDRLLQDVARRIVENVRKDDFVARIGGDEFNLIMPDTDRDTAVEAAERILEAMRQSFRYEQYELYATVSIGMSVFPYDGEDSVTLLKHADAALYYAKEQGKNNLKTFHTGMNMLSYRAFVLQNDLRKAIADGDLELYYQPKYEVKSGSIRSAEALLRWNHPVWGMIMPSEFISLAEQTGQMMEMGDWVLGAVCRQLHEWNRSGRPYVRVAVNISPMQFLQKDLVDKIDRAIREAGIRHEQIEVEITESTLLNNADGITQQLKQIRALGISISIDDFGTGYSSLSYLRRFPVDTIKIDKSFVQDMSADSRDSVALVSSIISLAGSLKMSVVAEGVETEEQLNLLEASGCQEIQGYWYCRPIPADEFERFVSSRAGEQSSRQSNLVAYPGAHQEAPKDAGRAPLIPQELSLEESRAIMQDAIRIMKETYGISAREIEVFEHLIDGLSNRQISDKLFISEHTVKNHITRLFQRLNVSDRMQAMSLVYQLCMEETQKQRAQ